MNKKYLIHYQARAGNLELEKSYTNVYHVEVPTREEAEIKAEELQDEGYENIIIEEVRV